MKILSKLIHLSIIFLSATQIAQGQDSLKIIQNSENNILVPASTLDTMIHDLNHWKLLKEKDKISQSYIHKIEQGLGIINSKLLENEILLKIEKQKRKRNGWQRNVLISVILIPTVLKLSGISLF